MEEEEQSIIIRSRDDVYQMLDDMLLKWDAEWWDNFYSDKKKPVPFFRSVPNENLHSYVENNILRGGRAIDIGCGNGRNAIYLAKCGFVVDAIDISQASINWARENAEREKVHVNFICDSIFHFDPPSVQYDCVHDTGCLHHLMPHRRSQYLEIVSNLLKPEGFFALACFNLKGGADISDYEVYEDGSMHGGMGYSEQKLRSILNDSFDIIEFRTMKNLNDDDLFGIDILWTVLMKKKRSFI